MADIAEPLSNKINMKDGRQEFNKEADDKCSKILIAIQVSLIVLFTVLSGWFFSFYINASN